jgi:PiT family inorganic phosphate transporter
MISAALAMAAGTWAGGWRIIRTLGSRVTHLTPTQGFAAESTTAGILWFTGTVGFPVSTTHTISSAVLGSGIARDARAVQWKIVGHVATAWIVTIPCAAAVGAAMQYLTHAPGGIVLVLACVAAIGAYAYARRDRNGPDLALDVDHALESPVAVAA